VGKKRKGPLSLIATHLLKVSLFLPEHHPPELVLTKPSVCASPIRNVEEQGFPHNLACEGTGEDDVCCYRGKEEISAQYFSRVYRVPEKEDQGHNPSLFPDWRAELIYHFHTVLWNDAMHKMCNKSPPVSIQSKRRSPTQSIYCRAVEFPCCSRSTGCQAPVHNS
jgi:hypothetical protein